MKTFVIIGLFSVLFLTSSCNKWLDLKPETQPNEEQILNSAEGYRAVLNGLYRTIGSAQLYGKDLTFGIVDCISQQYKLDLGNTVTYQRKYIAAGKFQYQDPSLSPGINDMWLKAFNVVANANNLIQNLEKKSPDFFSQGEMEKNLMLGEAYACRALMHFDMLRIFAPAPVNDDGKSYIPYVESYPTTVPTPISLQPFLDKVIADLTLARKLVTTWDNSVAGIGTLITGEARFFNTFSFGTEIYTNSNKYEDFFKGRGYHLNYYAVTALLARVYNYKGDYKQAFDYAKEVMDFEVKDYYGPQKAFALDKYTGAMSNNWDTKTDLKTVSNLIFAIHNGKAYNELELESHFKREFYSGSYPTWFVLNKDGQKIFETRDGVDESGSDYRSSFFIYLANGLYPISGKYFISEFDGIRDNNAMIIPVIRSTEMRYIMAEYHARNNAYSQAAQILSGIRSNRGLSQSVNISDWAQFQDELIRDARREYISEGQLFYLYKRLNAPVNFGQNVVRPLTRAEYLLPIPSIQL